MAIIEARNLHKSYRTRAQAVPVLRGIDVTVEPGEFVAVMGPSGCGKSTLLYVLGLMAHYDSGTVTVDGEDVTQLGESGRARLRRDRVGFVFQRFNLLPALSAAENVALPLELGQADAHAGARPTALLERVGLTGKAHHRPWELSMGEQQRVAVARSLVRQPAVLLADEPTGNLDTETGRRVLDLLAELNREDGQTIVMVTHDAEAAAWAGRTVRMRDGAIEQ